MRSLTAGTLALVSGALLGLSLRPQDCPEPTPTHCPALGDVRCIYAVGAQAPAVWAYYPAPTELDPWIMDGPEVLRASGAGVLPIMAFRPSGASSRIE